MDKLPTILEVVHGPIIKPSFQDAVGKSVLLCFHHSSVFSHGTMTTVNCVGGPTSGMVCLSPVGL